MFNLAGFFTRAGGRIVEGESLDFAHFSYEKFVQLKNIYSAKEYELFIWIDEPSVQ